MALSRCSFEIDYSFLRRKGEKPELRRSCESQSRPGQAMLPVFCAQLGKKPATSAVRGVTMTTSIDHVKIDCATPSATLQRSKHHNHHSPRLLPTNTHHKTFNRHLHRYREIADMASTTKYQPAPQRDSFEESSYSQAPPTYQAPGPSSAPQSDYGTARRSEDDNIPDDFKVSRPDHSRYLH